MKKYLKGVLLFLFVIIPVFKVNAATKITELTLYGTEEFVLEGELPPYEVWTGTNQNVEIQAYGSNTNWSYITPGLSSWHGFGTDTPTAVVDNQTEYALRLMVETAEGYELDANLTVNYNEKDVDADVSLMDWGGYVYINLGKAIEPKTMNELSFEMTLPTVGTEIKKLEETGMSGEYEYTYTYPSVKPEIKSCTNCDYFSDELMFINAYPDSTGETTLFEGKIEANKEYIVEASIFLHPGYYFGKLSDFKVTVNGKEVEFKIGEFYEDYFEGSNQLLVYFKVPSTDGTSSTNDTAPVSTTGSATPAENTKNYTVSDDKGNSISFVNEEGKTFNATIIDYMTLSEKELTEKGITKEEYDTALKTIKDATKDSGTLVSVYSIEVNDGNTDIHEVEGGFQIKIKMTEAMKAYNSFKLVNIDEENFTAKDVITLKVEGDYLVGTLPHLSIYALTATNVTNPATGDNVSMWFGMLSISVIGLVLVNRKRLKNN